MIKSAARRYNTAAACRRSAGHRPVVPTVARRDRAVGGDLLVHDQLGADLVYFLNGPVGFPAIINIS